MSPSGPIPIFCGSSKFFNFLPAKSESSQRASHVHLWNNPLVYQSSLAICFLFSVAANFQCYDHSRCSAMAYPTSLVQCPTQTKGPNSMPPSADVPREYSAFSSHLCFSQCCTVACELTSYKDVSEASPLELTLFLFIYLLPSLWELGMNLDELSWRTIWGQMSCFTQNPLPLSQWAILLEHMAKFSRFCFWGEWVLS